jgi:hypothetical protein
MSDVRSIFEVLRSRLIERFGDIAPSRRELGPLEQTPDGWAFLRDDGTVVHVGRDGSEAEVDRQYAFSAIASLSRVVPLATAFIPRVPPEQMRVCPHCHGQGRPASVPEALAESITCYCGGLGWTYVSDE